MSAACRSCQRPFRRKIDASGAVQLVSQALFHRSRAEPTMAGGCTRGPPYSRHVSARRSLAGLPDRHLSTDEVARKHELARSANFAAFRHSPDWWAVWVSPIDGEIQFSRHLWTRSRPHSFPAPRPSFVNFRSTLLSRHRFRWRPMGHGNPSFAADDIQSACGRRPPNTTSPENTAAPQGSAKSLPSEQ